MNYIKFIHDLSGKNFSKDVAYNFISVVILGISGIFLNTIVGNHYGPTGLGIFNQAIAIYLIISLFSVLGLQTSVVKHSAEFKDDKENLNYIISTSILISLPFSLFITILFIIIPFFVPNIFFNNDVTKVTQFIIFGIPFFSMNKLYAALLNGMRDMRVYAVNQSFRWISISLLIYISILFNFQIKFTILSFALTELLLFIWMIIYTKKYFSFKFELKIFWIKTHLNYGLKTLLIGLLSEVNNKTDIFFIGFFLSSYYVGIYSIASTIINGLLMFSLMVNLNISPIISNLWAKGEIDQIRYYSMKIVKSTIIISLPIVILSAILFPLYISFFMKGTVYIKSLPVFYILLTGILLPMIFAFAGLYLSMANFLNISLLIMIIRISFNIISVFIFINIFGFWGAAISTSLTYSLYILLQYYFIKKKMGVNLFSFNNIIKE